MKKIGVIGGMGPEATALFYRMIIEKFQKKYKAKYDSDYPEMIIINLPVPDVVESIEDEIKTKSMIIGCAKKIEKYGADFIAIPCNTVQKYFIDIRRSVNIPVLNIIEETVNRVSKKQYNKIGLIATESTIKNNIYGKELDRKNIKQILPNKKEIKQLTKIIMNILSGKKLENNKKRIQKISQQMIKEGAQCIVLGCTDFSILVDEKAFDFPIIDSSKSLAQAVVLTSKNTNKRTKGK